MEQEIKVITKGWYARFYAPHYTYYDMQHLYGEVVEVEGILFFVFKHHPKFDRWGYIHFDTGRGLGDSRNFKSRKAAMDNIFIELQRPTDDGTKVKDKILEWKSESYVSLKETKGEPRILNYLNPKKEDPHWIFSLLRSNINWECNEEGNSWTCKSCGCSLDLYGIGHNSFPENTRCPHCGQTFYGVRVTGRDIKEMKYEEERKIL